MEEDRLAIGIYFGEDDLIMARLRAYGIRVLENQDNEPVTPAVVYIAEDHEAIVGNMAINYARIDPANAIYFIQHLIGRNFLDPVIQKEIMRASYQAVQADNGDIEISLRGKDYSVVELATFLFTALKRDAEVATDLASMDAVITLPAYFNDRQKAAVNEAAQKAGIGVIRIIPEPTAVVLAYKEVNNLESPGTFLVYSLNKHSFDATVLADSGGLYPILGQAGDKYLGGDDIDQVIVDWIIEQARLQHHVDPVAWRQDPDFIATLKNSAEQANIRLIKTDSTVISIPSIPTIDGGPLALEFLLSRDQLDRMMLPLIDRSIDLVYTAIQNAYITPDEVDHVLLAGPAANIPFIRQRLEVLFGGRVLGENTNLIHYCMAQGAAIQTRLAPEPEETPQPAEESVKSVPVTDVHEQAPQPAEDAFKAATVSVADEETPQSAEAVVKTAPVADFHEQAPHPAEAAAKAVPVAAAHEEALQLAEAAVKAAPVVAAPEAMPQNRITPVLCSCGVLNPAGRTTCCFCGESLSGAAVIVPPAAGRAAQPPKPAPAAPVPSSQHRSAARRKSRKKSALSATDETSPGIDVTSIYSGYEEK